MIEDEAMPREPPHELDRDRKVPRIDEDVVGEAELLQQSDAPPEVGSQQEAVVGLALHDVPHADEPRVIPKTLELRAGLRRAQVDPADDARYEGVALGQVEQPRGLLKAVLRLDGHAGREPGLRQERGQIGRQEIALESAHALVDPAVLLRVVFPEVLMRVDARAHGPTTTTTLPGPCTPSVSVSSMSAVRLGPVMNVQHAASPMRPAARAKNSPIVKQKSGGLTIATCTGGSSETLRECPGPDRTASEPVSAMAPWQPVTP